MITRGIPINDIDVLQSEAPKISKLVQITPITIWFMVLITSYNYSYWGL